MEFVWNMKEKEWKRMINEHVNHIDSCHNCYGNLYIGKLCIDFAHTKDMDAWYLYTSVFELGKDTGYGYTVDGNIPYDLLDAYIEIPVRCKTFDSFKKSVEDKVEKMIKEYGLQEQAEAPLGDWK